MVDYIFFENEIGKQIFLGYDKEGCFCYYFNLGCQNIEVFFCQV